MGQYVIRIREDKIKQTREKTRKTWARKEWYQEFCDCRGHKEIINPKDCLCSPDNAEDLRFCKKDYA